MFAKLSETLFTATAALLLLAFSAGPPNALAASTAAVADASCMHTVEDGEDERYLCAICGGSFNESQAFAGAVLHGTARLAVLLGTVYRV